MDFLPADRVRLVSLPSADARTTPQATIAVGTLGTVVADSTDQIDIHVQWDCHSTCHVVFPIVNVEKV